MCVCIITDSLINDNGDDDDGGGGGGGGWNNAGTIIRGIIGGIMGLMFISTLVTIIII